jgi:hypothetical protein
VLALWIPLPFGSGRGLALPVLFSLYVSAKRGGERQTPACRRRASGRGCKRHAEHQPLTKLDLLRETVAVVAQWVGKRTVYLVVDSAYAGRTVQENRPTDARGDLPASVSDSTSDAARGVPGDPAGASQWNPGH